MKTKNKRKITVRAMVLRYHYTRTFVHSLNDLLSDLEYGRWWKHMDNYNRAYVLTGRKK